MFYINFIHFGGNPVSKSITIDTGWYEIISDYAASHYMTKKDTLTMLLDISIGRKNTFNDWYFDYYLKGVYFGRTVQRFRLKRSDGFEQTV